MDFNLSFINSAFRGGAVSGIIRGLTDDAVSMAASVEVTCNSAGFGLGEYGQGQTNSFTVADGAIIDADFQSFGALNSLPSVTTSVLQLRSINGFPAGTLAGLAPEPDNALVGSNVNLSFSAVDKPAVVPLPASVPLLLLGLATLVRIRRLQSA